MKVIKVLKFIYDMIQNGIIAFAIVLVILYLIGIRPYIVQTGSMEPTIPTGSICIVNHNAKYESVQIDDVIAFKNGEMMVTHRVVAVDEDGLHTKGDANNMEDTSPVIESNFVGKTLFWIPSIGIIIAFIRTKFGTITLILSVMLFLIIGFILDKVSDSKPEDKASGRKEG